MPAQSGMFRAAALTYSEMAESGGAQALAGADREARGKQRARNAHVQDRTAGLQLIYGARTDASLGDAQSAAPRGPGSMRLFRRSSAVIYAVLMRHVAGTCAAGDHLRGTAPGQPIDLREAALALGAGARVAAAYADSGVHDETSTTWVAVGSTAPSLIVFGAAGKDTSDITIHCAIEDVTSGSASVALFPEVTGGNFFSRGARRRRADELCQSLMSTASLAITRHAGSTSPRCAPREFARGSALLLVHGASFRGELCEISAGGVSATIPRHALSGELPGRASSGGVMLRSAVGLSGTLITCLKHAHVTQSVRIVHLWSVAHGLRVGMLLT